VVVPVGVPVGVPVWVRVPVPLPVPVPEIPRVFDAVRVRVIVGVGLKETARFRVGVGETVIVEKASPSITNRDKNLITS